MTPVRLLLPTLAILPALASAVGSAPASLSALSAIAIDAQSGKTLYAKYADASRFPASTTKIMTGLLLAERCKPNDIIVAPADVENVKEASMHLKPGERVRAKDMLAAVMLRSANDGCYAVAIHLAGSVEKFAQMMNERARQMGCTGTNFHNPNGLNDPHHITTARDLAIMGREAMKNPLFASVVKTYKTKIARSLNAKDLWMVNHNKRLPKDPTCDGIKTGWTIPAGKCFVGTVNREGWRAITVVMKAKDWQADTVTLTDWAYDRYEKRDSVVQGQVIAEPQVERGLTPVVALTAAREAYNLVPKGSPIEASHREIVLNPNLTAPIQKGQACGVLLLRDAEGFEQRIPLLADRDVEAAPSVVVKATQSRSGLWIGGAMLLGVAALRSKSRRRIIRAARP